MGKPARRRGHGRGDDSDSADDDPRGSSVRGVDRVDRGADGRTRGARRSSRHAPRPGEVGFEGLDDDGRSQSMYKGMSRVAVKRLLERKAAEAAGNPARRPPPLEVPAVTAGIVDACAHLHLVARRACDAARVPHTPRRRVATRRTRYHAFPRPCHRPLRVRRQVSGSVLRCLDLPILGTTSRATRRKRPGRRPVRRGGFQPATSRRDTHCFRDTSQRSRGGEPRRAAPPRGWVRARDARRRRWRRRVRLRRRWRRRRREDDADGGVGRHARHRARRFGGCRGGEGAGWYRGCRGGEGEEWCRGCRGGEGEEWCLWRLAAPVGVSAVAGVGDERGRRRRGP